MPLLIVNIGNGWHGVIVPRETVLPCSVNLRDPPQVVRRFLWLLNACDPGSEIARRRRLSERQCYHFPRRDRKSSLQHSVRTPSLMTSAAPRIQSGPLRCVKLHRHHAFSSDRSHAEPLVAHRQSRVPPLFSQHRVIVRLAREDLVIWSTLNGTLTLLLLVGTVPFMRTDSTSDFDTGFGDLYPQFTLRWNAGVQFHGLCTRDVPVGQTISTRLSNIRPWPRRDRCGWW